MAWSASEPHNASEAVATGAVAGTALDSYDRRQLSLPVVAPIQLGTSEGDNGTRLMRFSSLSPAVLAFMSQATNTPDTQHIRIVDKAGRVMPMALRQVQKSSNVSYQVPAVAVEADNPAAMEKLRQAIRIQIEKSAQSSAANPSPSINIALNDLPSNQPLAQSNPQISTWWLANPTPSKGESAGHNTQLHLAFSQTQQPRPVQLQLYGSDDLQSWQMLSQTVVNPFNTVNTATSPPVASQPTIAKFSTAQQTLTRQTLELADAQAKYRYWQLVASQPLALIHADASQTLAKTNYFLTRATFNQLPNDTTHWQLKLPTPMWVSGMAFFVPEKQLWQVSITGQPSDTDGLTSLTATPRQADGVSLGTGQVDSTQPRLHWTPTTVQNLSLTGQMPTDSLPVTLLTPVYQLYFLAQGQAPYRLLINDPTALQQPVITLSNEQLNRLGTGTEAQLLPLMAVENPDAKSEKYRQWGLWAVLLLTVAVLSWLAYRLYQQITTQRPAE